MRVDSRCLFQEDGGQQIVTRLLFLKQVNETNLDGSPKFVMTVVVTLRCLLQMKERGHPYPDPKCPTYQPGLQHLRKLVSKVGHAASPWRVSACFRYTQSSWI
jgi:hypothetical protein